MFPRNGRGNHRLNNDYTRQKQTDELINFAILDDIFDTVNLDNKTATIQFHHKA